MKALDDYLRDRLKEDADSRTSDEHRYVDLLLRPWETFVSHQGREQAFEMIDSWVVRGLVTTRFTGTLIYVTVLEPETFFFGEPF